MSLIDCKEGCNSIVECLMNLLETWNGPKTCEINFLWPIFLAEGYFVVVRFENFSSRCKLHKNQIISLKWRGSYVENVVFMEFHCEFISLCRESGQKIDLTVWELFEQGTFKGKMVRKINSGPRPWGEDGYFLLHMTFSASRSRRQKIYGRVNKIMN